MRYFLIIAVVVQRLNISSHADILLIKWRGLLVSLDTIMSYYYEEASGDDIIMRTLQFTTIGPKSEQSH